MFSIARTSVGVSRYGDVRGQEDWSSSAHARCSRRQAWNRLGDTRRNRRTACNGRYSRARSAARRIRILVRPSGRRSPMRRNPDVRNRASASRSRAVSFWTRRRSFRTSPVTPAPIFSLVPELGVDRNQRVTESLGGNGQAVGARELVLLVIGGGPFIH